MIRNVIEFVGDCCFVLTLLAQYVLVAIAGLAWCVVLALPLSAHAGGYCYHNNNYVQHEYVHDYVPQTIIERQNIEAFFQVPNYVTQYAVTPSAVQLAKLGELERANQQERDRINEQRALYTQAQQVQPQQYAQPAMAQPVCVVPQGYMLVPQNAAAQQPAVQPQPQPVPQPAPAQPGASSAPRFSERASIVQQACLKCHGGNKVEADLDFTKELTCEQKQKAITKAAVGEMPKNGPKLTPEQFVQLSKEIAALKSAGASSGNNDAE